MTDFMGVGMCVQAWDWLAVRRLSMADTNAVMWISRMPPSAETGSWSSSLGVVMCRARLGLKARAWAGL